MRKWRNASAALSGVILLAAPVLAMPASSVEEGAGLGIAERVCSECHGVRRGETTSPHVQAPSFTAVANAPGRTETWLRIWFQSPHRSMPELNLNEADSNALIVYILSLKRQNER